MKIFLKAYINKNLGDDIFLKIFSERYRNSKILIPENAKYLNLDNAEYYKFDKKIEVINKLIRLITFGKVSYLSIIKQKCDVSVLIGGSMFIEREVKGFWNNLKKKFISELKYDYIMGANFGPFFSKLYYKTYYKLFSKSKNVCFRDKYSYNLFSKLSNVNLAPDIVFLLDINRYKICNEKRVIFSVIDSTNRFKKEISDNYYKNLSRMVKFYIERDYEVCLMSFCKNEGDEAAMNKIENLLNNDKRIKTYKYNGNIDEAINLIAKSEIIVGTRFHANILGGVFGKKVIPIAYSDKTINVLNDINFKGIKYDIRENKDIDLENLKCLDNNYIDVKELKSKANLHFDALDKVLLN